MITRNLVGMNQSESSSYGLLVCVCLKKKTSFLENLFIKFIIIRGIH